MSHASNKIKWCLDKAKKELEHGKKHRGLIVRQQSNETANKHLAKAEHNLKAVFYLQKGGFEDWSISAGFYCLYHCMLAILAKYGYESRNQECTLAVVENLIQERKLLLDIKFVNALKEYKTDEHHEATVIELRELFQYGLDVKVDSTKLNELIAFCKELIDAVKEILSKEGVNE